MTRLEKFERIKPQLQEAMEKAIFSAAKKCPEGFLDWLGVEITPRIVKRIRNI